MPILLHARVHDIWFRKPSLETMGRWGNWHELTVITPRSFHVWDTGESNSAMNLRRYIEYPAASKYVSDPHSYSPRIVLSHYYERPKILSKQVFLCSIDYGSYNRLEPVQWYLRADQLGTWLGAPMESPHVYLPPDILADWMEDKAADDERYALSVLRLREILKNLIPEEKK